MNLLDELPMGFGMALAKNTDAMAVFSNLSIEKQQDIIDKTHCINSKKEMQSFVNSLSKNQIS
ncbi:MAG: hypothetical protein PUD24_03455 [Oscillospiraceae bacterium]|nr:hypothetical protein [Oscillospiraceae bacterium]